MKTVSVSDETHNLVNNIQDELPWSATKKEIIAESVELFYEQEIEEEN